jgi:hypothetical protein
LWAKRDLNSRPPACKAGALYQLSYPPENRVTNISIIVEYTNNYFLSYLHFFYIFMTIPEFPFFKFVTNLLKMEVNVMSKLFKTGIMVIYICILTVNLYPNDNDSSSIKESINKPSKIYCRLNYSAGSSIWQNKFISYSLSLGYKDNEVGIGYRNYVVKVSSVTAYWLYRLNIVFFVPIYQTLELNTVDAFNYEQITIFYTKLFRVYDWLSFNINAGLGYGLGYDRKAINETTNTISETSGVLGMEYIKEYRCDIKESSFNSFAFPVGISVDLDIWSWLSISMGYEYNNTSKFTDNSVKFDLSIFLFRE